MHQETVPIRYIPPHLSKKDKLDQQKMLKRSKKLYKKHIYYTRKQLPSYHNKRSKHLKHAEEIYHVRNITPNKQLSIATGCSLEALNKIVEKGEGAYYSSGSRPNQTPQSWGVARLASAITAGKSAAVDYNILDKGCDHRKTAYRLAKTARKKYKYGHSRTRKVRIG